MSKFAAPIVGMHFRPPAAAILAVMHASCPLVLEAEPMNPYDPHAVKVLVDFVSILESMHGDLAMSLPQYGSDLDAIREQGRIHLGYIDSKKTGMAKMVQQALRNAESGEYDNSYTAVLAFNTEGKPVANIEITD